MNLTVPIEMDLKRNYKKSNDRHKKYIKKYITYRKYTSCEQQLELE